MSKTEIWKDIPGYEGAYQASDLGRIRSLSRRVRSRHKTRVFKGRVLKQMPQQNGYTHVELSINQNKKRTSVHSLVIWAFMGYKTKVGTVCIDHINNNKKDNRLCNLRIITQRENFWKGFELHNKSCSSSWRGVRKRFGKYQARISENGKRRVIGTFESEKEAGMAYLIELKKFKDGK
jgi:hypothetical protein